MAPVPQTWHLQTHRLTRVANIPLAKRLVLITKMATPRYCLTRVSLKSHQLLLSWDPILTIYRGVQSSFTPACHFFCRGVQWVCPNIQKVGRQSLSFKSHGLFSDINVTSTPTSTSPQDLVDTIKALVGLMAHLPQWKTKNAVILHLGVFPKLPRPKISCGFPSLNDRFRGSFNHQMFRRIHLACYAKSLV